jgi:transposase-like protein
MKQQNEIIKSDNPITELMQMKDGNFLQNTLTVFLNAMMRAEAENLTGANYYSHNADRINSFNGKRPRNYKTSMGNLSLEIPKLRQGTYFPEFLEPRKMTDKMLQNIILQSYINGTATRKVEKLVKDMGIHIDKNEVSRITAQLQEKVDAFKNRLITKSYTIIYVRCNISESS